MGRAHWSAAAVEFLDYREFDLGAVAEVRVPVRIAESFAGEVCLSAGSQCGQTDAYCGKLLCLRARRVLLSCGMELPELGLEVRV
ncbi:hypothetical protein [Kribbella sp. NPDC023855]|uniref:hypothetical protein n=1 Tax=Kribbella sp. NPDC023855 TaxID=3154698 RepID=UPI0033F43869